MAEVIHTIKNNQYLYEHHREGDKVVCDYIGPVGSSGGIRKAKHGGGPNRVTQQTTRQTNKRKTINSKRDNSRVGRDQSEERKSTMKQKNKLERGEEDLEKLENRLVMYGQDHPDDKVGKKNLHKKYMAALDNVNQLKSERRIEEIQEKNKNKPTKPEKPYQMYEGITAHDIDTTPPKRDHAHEKRMRETAEWQRKFDSD